MGPGLHPVPDGLWPVSIQRQRCVWNGKSSTIVSLSITCTFMSSLVLVFFPLVSAPCTFIRHV